MTDSGFLISCASEPASFANSAYASSESFAIDLELPESFNALIRQSEFQNNGTALLDLNGSQRALMDLNDLNGPYGPYTFPPFAKGG